MKGYSLTVAVWACIGFLLLFLGIQVASYLLIVATVAGSAGFKIAIATLISSLVTIIISIWLTKIFGNTEELLGFYKFNKKYLTGSLGLLVIFILVSQLLDDYYSESSPMDFMDELMDSSSFGLFLLLVVLIAPIYEELAFRGFVMGVVLKAKSSLSTKQRWLVATAISSLAFTAIHLQYDWFGLVLIFVLSLILAWARLISGSVILPMILHFINNSLAMVVYLLK